MKNWKLIWACFYFINVLEDFGLKETKFSLVVKKFTNFILMHIQMIMKQKNYLFPKKGSPRG